VVESCFLLVNYTLPAKEVTLVKVLIGAADEKNVSEQELRKKELNESDNRLSKIDMNVEFEVVDKDAGLMQFKIEKFYPSVNESVQVSLKYWESRASFNPWFKPHLSW